MELTVSHISRRKELLTTPHQFPAMESAENHLQRELHTYINMVRRSVCQPNVIYFSSALTHQMALSGTVVTNVAVSANGW